MSYIAKTDAGSVRKNNEDTVRCEEFGEAVVLAVCDGMGGYIGGAEASTLAADAFMDSLKQFFAEDGTAAGIPRALESACEKGRGAIVEFVSRHLDCEKMGTTLVSAVVIPSADADFPYTAYFANIGDSRGYLLRAGELMQVTDDHSVVGEMLRSGQITREEAEIHPNKNLITKALSAESEYLPDIFIVPLMYGDMIMLCSDGLYNAVSDREMRDILTRHEQGRENPASVSFFEYEPERLAMKLIGTALLNIAKDNVSVILWDSKEKE
ncbi:MAG: protein phosphatase 2C domain-containing protein [Oscillospiraceae bacterium]|jgi:protein phosphatase|nr:protein phosphatase 2C domain-containing protein [Oscillospiraceae bacterium]